MRAALVIAVAALAGCALKVPPTHDEVIVQALPATTRIPPAWQAAAATSPVADDWLKSFNDPALDALVAEAIANNLGLAVTGRVAQFVTQLLRNANVAARRPHAEIRLDRR